MSDKQFEDLLCVRDFNEKYSMSRICHTEIDNEIQGLLFDFFRTIS